MGAKEEAQDLVNHLVFAINNVGKFPMNSQNLAFISQFLIDNGFNPVEIDEDMLDENNLPRVIAAEYK